MGIISTGPGGPLAFAGASGGKTFAFNNLTTTGAQVVAANPSRQRLTFHNPGTVDAFVYPLKDGNGATLAPTTSALGGCFRIFGNGGSLLVQGECQFAWGAFSVSGSGNPLTVMDSNT